MAAPRPGIASDPSWLAAGAGGLLAAALALWAARGLPGGTLLLWAVPVPIMLAGLVAGPIATLGAALLAMLGIWALGSLTLLLVAALLLVIPAMALTVLGVRRQGIALAAPMVFLGLYPLALLLGAALAFADHQGGLAGVLERMLRNAMAQIAVPGIEPVIEMLLFFKAALLAFWMALIWVANAAMAVRLAGRITPTALPPPDWRTALLPAWYAVLPALAGLLWLTRQEDSIAFSGFLILLLPFFFQGMAGVHRRAAALQGRRFIIIGYYLAMLIFLQLTAPATVALGLYDQWAQRAPRGGLSI